MTDSIIKTNSEYTHWLKGIKQSFLQTQLKAAISVNTSLLEFYWQLGGEIIEKQKNAQWGDGFLNQLSQDLISEFPDIQGFSKRNLELIRRWVRFWSEASIAKQAVSQLPLIPWGHNIAIMQKCKNHVEALFYVQNTLKHGWSRNVLVHQIESGLYQRDAKAITNFEQTLPPLQSDLALQTLKIPMCSIF
ncbi:DUF1016 N-terminal domain-containing protein [Cellvibrio sp. UBA7661]|uniref:DUF1016 N-terminal domain-containing protein n=1 Tax=Cellvibrio sp. UBA7661 TaxID=1946311 RepID=UPI002F35A902